MREFILRHYEGKQIEEHSYGWKDIFFHEPLRRILKNP